MNKKNIQIIVIIVCFAGAGFVLYRGFHGSSSSSLKQTSIPGSTPATQGQNASAGNAAATASNTGGHAQNSAPAAAVSGDKILPLGNTLDIDKVFSLYNFQFGAYNYPVLNTSTEVGVNVGMLVKPEQKTDINSPH